MSKVRCFACNQYGHYASQCLEKKKKKKEEDTVVAATAEEADFARRFKKEFSFFSLISSSDSNGVVQNGTWYIDSGASRHMTGIWHIFCIIAETGPNRFVHPEGGHARAMRGVGKVRFQLSHGGYLDQDGVLFVPGMRVNLLSVSALEYARNSTLFWRGHVYIFTDIYDLGHVYIYSERAGLIDP